MYDLSFSINIFLLSVCVCLYLKHVSCKNTIVLALVFYPFWQELLACHFISVFSARLHRCNRLIVFRWSCLLCAALFFLFHFLSGICPVDALGFFFFFHHDNFLFSISQRVHWRVSILTEKPKQTSLPTQYYIVLWSVCLTDLWFYSHSYNYYINHHGLRWDLTTK